MTAFNTSSAIAAAGEAVAHTLQLTEPHDR